MKKITSFLGILFIVCLAASPALAIAHLENTSCEGPSKIFFAKQVFERQPYVLSCAPSYKISSFSDEKGVKTWAPYSKFYSKLIDHPQGSVLETVQSLLPAQAKIGWINNINPDDIMLSFVNVEDRGYHELLSMNVVRALKQSDQSVRIYQFEMTIKAYTHNKDGVLYHPDVRLGAYMHFNDIVNKNKKTWFNAIQHLDTQD